MWATFISCRRELSIHVLQLFHFLTRLPSFLATWKRGKGIDIPYTSWTARCCDLLEKYGKNQGDIVLAAQTRVTSILSQASKTLNEKYDQGEEDRRIMVAGFKFELAQMESSLAFPLSISG